MKRNLWVTLLVMVLLCGVSLGYAGRYTKDPTKEFVSGIKLYKGVRYKNLLIIPVRVQKSLFLKNLLTLDEAIDKGVLVVKEVDKSGRVNSLAVWNNFKNKYVYIMAGEILEGSKQDRVLQEDVLLPPQSGKVIVKVFCVEHGRWAYKSEQFYSKRKSANIYVRQMAKTTYNQSMVWESVAKTNRALGAASSTGTLSKTYDSKEFKRFRKKYTQRFSNIPVNYPKATGVVVLVNGKVLVADVFSNRHIFSKLWNKLLDSYIAEALVREKEEVPSDISDPHTFLDMVGDAKIYYTQSVGVGQNIEIKSDKITGSGLIQDKIPLHIDLFPKIKEETIKSQNRIWRNYQQRIEPNQRPIR